jgi:hypothetical protein
MSQGYDKLDTTGNIVAATITLTSLASSATAGRQSSVITLVDGNQRVPPIIDIDFWCKLATGTVANDKSAYLFMARSVDETNYESGPPNVGASDAAFTFSNSPVGTTPLPTDLRLIGSITFNAQSEAHRHQFQIVAPPPKLVFVVLNYSGIAFTSTGSDHGIQIRKRWPELV